MKQNSLTILFVLLVLLAGFFLLQNNKTAKQTTQTTKHAPLPKEVTITLDKNGFSPKEVTINVGSAVRWKNVSGDKQTVNSDDYPTNQLHKELNFGIFNNGSTVVYIFTKPGIYGFHNQYHYEQQGKVIVKG